MSQALYILRMLKHLLNDKNPGSVFQLEVTVFIMEYHKRMLQSCCRICGQFWSENISVKKNRNKIRFRPPVMNYQDMIIDACGRDVSTDIEGVHPGNMCKTCYLKILKYKKMTSTGQEMSRRSLTTFEFQPHAENACKLCESYNNYTKGTYIFYIYYFTINCCIIR